MVPLPRSRLPVVVALRDESKEDLLLVLPVVALRDEWRCR
jgi:hypothetical protein